ncbi:putative uncharacterized protein [Firmicutes bacterium CAG:466]|nr:putative uncharacterized protein [Firmicutes bacterium CAG:466]
MRLFQCQKLGDGVAARTSNDHICCREQVCQTIGDIFKLAVSLYTFQTFFLMTFAAKMDDIKILQQRRQAFPQGIIELHCPQRTAHLKQNRLCAVKTAGFQTFLSVPCEQFRTNRCPCVDAFFLGHIFQCFRERGADSLCKRHRNLVCQTRCNIRFMDDNGNLIFLCPQHHRHCYKAAFGEYQIRFQFF